MKGYQGRILKVDLSSGKFDVLSLDSSDAKKFIGGSGLGARILHEMTSPKTNPLSRENVLIFLTGPLTGTKFFSSNRYYSSLSPVFIFPIILLLKETRRYACICCTLKY